jgi:hypothetical protein
LFLISVTWLPSPGFHRRSSINSLPVPTSNNSTQASRVSLLRYSLITKPFRFPRQYHKADKQ